MRGGVEDVLVVNLVRVEGPAGDGGLRGQAPARLQGCGAGVPHHAAQDGVQVRLLLNVHHGGGAGVPAFHNSRTGRLRQARQ